MESEEDPSSLHGGRVGLTAGTAPRYTKLLKQTSETVSALERTQYVGIMVWQKTETCKVTIREAKGNSVSFKV